MSRNACSVEAERTIASNICAGFHPIAEAAIDVRLAWSSLPGRRGAAMFYAKRQFPFKDTANIDIPVSCSLQKVQTESQVHLSLFAHINPDWYLHT